MEVQCITSKKKWLKIEKHDDAWSFGNVRVQVKKIYLKKATLSSILELICVDASGTCHYFNRDWTKKPMLKTIDDEQRVADMNNAVTALVGDIDCTVLDDRFKFEGNYGKSGTCSFYAQDKHVLSPDGRMVLPYSKIETIWLERAQPSTVIKTFDVTFIVDRKPITLGMVSKVLYRHKFVHQAPKKPAVRHNTRPSRSVQPKNVDTTKIFTEFRVYVTEDDDLNWNILLKMKNQEGYTWDHVYQDYVGEDELSADDQDGDGWESLDTEDDGETEEDSQSDYSGETEEEEILSEDDEEQDYPSGDSSDDSEYSDDDVVGKKRLKRMQSPPPMKRQRFLTTVDGIDTDTDEEEPCEGDETTLCSVA